MGSARLGAILASFAVMVMLGAACSSGGGGNEVEMTLRDFEIDLPDSDLAAGETTFTAANEGPSTHEFEIFSVPAGVDANILPVENDVADTDAEGLEVIDEVEDIAPSTSASLKVTLEPGTYALICNLPSHYAQGMHTTFTAE